MRGAGRSTRPTPRCARAAAIADQRAAGLAIPLTCSPTAQILYCAIQNPPSFPPIVDVPPEGSRSSAHAGEGSAALLYTGDNMTLADAVAENLLARRLGLNIAILRCAPPAPPPPEPSLEGARAALLTPEPPLPQRAVHAASRGGGGRIQHHG